MILGGGSTGQNSAHFNRDRGPVNANRFPPTPPGMQVRTGRFEALRFPFVRLSLSRAVGTASYPVLVHRPAASIHASSPHSVSLMQLRFTPLTVTSLRRDSTLKNAPMPGAPKKRRERKTLPSQGVDLIERLEGQFDTGNGTKAIIIASTTSGFVVVVEPEDRGLPINASAKGICQTEINGIDF